MSDGPNLRRAGPYRITGLLGSGGSASIYAAQDTNDQEVALKVFSHQHDRWLERFTQEANHLKHIDHPNVVRMIEAGIDGHLAYLAMELIHGHDLTASNTLRERQNWPEIVRIGVEICNGLNAIHQAHLIHRDIKPSNVMLGNDGRVVITDFGLVRNEDHEASVSEDGKIIGTPAYLAPEQVSQHLCPLSPLTDIYGVAGCLYYLITGHAPNHGNTLWAILSSIISEPFPDPTAITPHCPPRLAELILRAGNKIPEQRFESASELAMALTECKLGQSTVTTAIPTIDAEPPDQLTKPAVLLIDDDPVIRKIYSALLSKQGCKLSVGNNCQEARTKLQTEHYRMVILDLLLGDGHGSELIPLIKQTQPHECSIVILSDLAGQSLDGFDVTTALCKWTTTPRRVIERVMNILSGRLDLANDLLAPPPDDDVHARASGPQPPSEPDPSEND